MSSATYTKCYFGFTLSGEEASLKLWDNSAGVYREFNVPAGMYFYKHAESSRDLVAVLNTLLTGYCTISRWNDRQVKFTFTDTNDHLRLLDVDDSERIACALGLHDNTGDLTYYQTHNIANLHLAQVSGKSFFTHSGKVYETPTMAGLPTWDSLIYKRQDSVTSWQSGDRKSEIELTLTSVVSAHVTGFALGTQTVLGNTENGTSTVSLWRAYDPSVTEPVFYLECLEDGAGAVVTGTYWLNRVIEPNDVKPVVQNYSGLYNVKITAYVEE